MRKHDLPAGGVEELWEAEFSLLEASHDHRQEERSAQRLADAQSLSSSEVPAWRVSLLSRPMGSYHHTDRTVLQQMAPVLLLLGADLVLNLFI